MVLTAVGVEVAISGDDNNVNQSVVTMIAMVLAARIMVMIAMVKATLVTTDNRGSGNGSEGRDNGIRSSKNKESSCAMWGELILIQRTGLGIVT